MRRFPMSSFILGLAVVAGLSVQPLAAQSKTVGPDAAKLKAMQKKATDFLRTSQGDDGSWTTPAALGISGIVTTAMLESGLSPSEPSVAKALKYLEKHVQKDGGIYVEKSTHRNYETCICMMAFAAANKDGKYTKTIKNAEHFLRKLQWDQGEGIEDSDVRWGGAGYGGGGTRPDLSNTAFLVEALKAAGAKANDPAIQKALKFVSQSQNLESEHNTTKFAVKVNDGGFFYTPAAGGQSRAGNTPNGGLRSYGSMTYSGLKSMIYAGLTDEDKRVKAAIAWIRKYYTVENNPGMTPPKQGYFYYAQMFAKALDVMKLDYMEDAKGVKHDWRKELAEQLMKEQRANGSWVNKAERWYEGDPNLATAYALLALSHCQPKAVK